MTALPAPRTSGSAGARHLGAARLIHLVPATGFAYSPRGRTGLEPGSGFLARHAASVTGIGVIAGLAGSSATAIALMLGLGR